MSLPLQIGLEFGPGVPPIVKARILYAFRVFAAIYGHTVNEANAIGRRVVYGPTSPSASPTDRIHVPARYALRPKDETPPEPIRHRFADEEFHLVYGLDETTRQPDWLAEIFEWLSSSREMISSRRDAIGRIPLSETPFSRHALSPREPHALKIMAWFEGVLQNGRSEERLPKPHCPLSGAQHLVICSHDIDFYYTDRVSLLVRLLKNLIIAFHLYRSWEFFRWNALRMLALFGGASAGDYLPALLDACEKHDFQSTLFVVANRFHRRDPNYSLRQISAALLQSRSRRLSIGLHGSYESIIERKDLRGEVAALHGAIDAFPMGGRQHYLRFDRHQALFSAVEQAGLFYDSTLGFTDTVGFRNGAAFAFPPYDFARERAHSFLEIPLVLMDGGLEAACRISGEEPSSVAEQVLAASRKWGWGGIGIDWHNPIEPIQVPPAINDAFWQCLRRKGSRQERWISGDELLRVCLSRYHAAGLLQDVRCDA